MPESGIRRPRPAVKLLVVACGVAAGLLIFEVFLRAVGYSYPLFYTTDDVRGYALRPGAEGWFRGEGESYVRISSAGLRDREHAREKPPGTLRVAVLGDSYSEAMHVEQEKTFWAVFERGLGGCGALGGREVEVINFGVSGYGTALELLTLREKVWDYAPDVVLLAVTTNNDVVDNVPALKNSDEMPYPVLRDGQLTFDNSFRETAGFRWRRSAPGRAAFWLRDNLRFVQAIYGAQSALKRRMVASRNERAQARAVAAALPAAPSPAEGSRSVGAFVPDQANMIYAETSDPVWREGWALTEMLMARMAGEVRARGARFVLVTLSNPIQAHPSAAAREAFARRHGVRDLFYPERRFKALGEREGFPAFNLAPDLQLYAEQHQSFLHGFGRDLGNGHWNETGHRVAGQLLAQKLCEALAH